MGFDHPGSDWRPTASVPALVERSRVLRRIRQFFEERQVIEVETPVLAHATGTDPFIDSIEFLEQDGSCNCPALSLSQTSAQGSARGGQNDFSPGGLGMKAGAKHGAASPSFSSMTEGCKPTELSGDMNFDSRQIREDEKSGSGCRRGRRDPDTPRAPCSARAPIWADTGSPGQRKCYLQTSPEFGMKRLLAAGMPSIYQITKSFRAGEEGRHHNPEFTMLEWYRLGFDHHQLIDEVDQFFQMLLGCAPAERLTYQELFQRHCQGLDPHVASVEEIRDFAYQADIASILGGGDVPDRDRETWIQLIMTEYLEQKIGKVVPTFIYDFPISQASLARIRPGNPPVAERFEVYFQGMELGNGFHELSDASEQRRRFDAELQKRNALGKPQVQRDERFLSALDHGLPESAGVACGVDRLVMLALQADRIEDVIAFPYSRV